MVLELQPLLALLFLGYTTLFVSWRLLYNYWYYEGHADGNSCNSNIEDPDKDISLPIPEGEDYGLVYIVIATIPFWISSDQSIKSLFYDFDKEQLTFVICS
jgi:hypothetical protein